MTELAEGRLADHPGGATLPVTAAAHGEGLSRRTGFASASKAFGHRYLLGFLEQRGLARATVTQL